MGVPNEDPRTETHKLGTERNSENYEIENLNHLGIGVGAAGYKNCPDVEQNSFREVNERTGDTMSATFDEGTLNSGGVSILYRLFERPLKEPLKRHSTN